MKLVPRPSYRIGQNDALKIDVLGAMPKQPIHGLFNVENDGIVTLGPAYGVFRVLGLTVEEAEVEITRSLRLILSHPVVTVQLSRSATVEQLTNQYPVEPDGVINLRSYGMVDVTGKTVAEAREAVLARLSQYFDSPQVGVDVLQYNSNSYCIITEALGGRGNMWRFPITGNETVLDAIGRLVTVSRLSSKTMWVARPMPEKCGQEQILPVEWRDITQGLTATNYQLMPGDRLYIVDDSLVAMDRFIGKFTTPINRLLGISSLGADTGRTMETLGRSFNSNRML